MHVRVLLFAQVAADLKTRSIDLPWPNAVAQPAADTGDEPADHLGHATVGDALAWLESQHPALAKHRPSLAFAVNNQFVTITAPLHPGDELALIPPVSGG